MSGNQPLYNAAIRIVEINKGAFTDTDGKFITDSLPNGNYTIEISSLGYEKLTLQVTVPGKFLTYKLRESANNIKQVTIEGKSKATLMNESAFAVKSIDVKPLYARSTNVLELINQTAGIKVQQDGGLGSFSNVMVNGLSGPAIS